MTTSILDVVWTFDLFNDSAICVLSSSALGKSIWQLSVILFSEDFSYALSKRICHPLAPSLAQFLSASICHSLSWWQGQIERAKWWEVWHCEQMRVFPCGGPKHDTHHSNADCSQLVWIMPPTLAPAGRPEATWRLEATGPPGKRIDISVLLLVIKLSRH